MFDLHCFGNYMGEFSRSHCVAICAFLVPANLIATSQTLLFTILKRSSSQIFTICAASIIYALLMISHVISWFIIGVVMAPTFILVFLGVTCLAINITAIWLKVKRIDGVANFARSLVSQIGVHNNHFRDIQLRGD